MEFDFMRFFGAIPVMLEMIAQEPLAVAAAACAIIAYGFGLFYNLTNARRL